MVLHISTLEKVERFRQNDHTLTTLDLSDNEIGDDGATDIAKALRANTTLTMLNLDRNEIGVDGATAIAEALQTNTT
eukprot:CAMPEP_0194438114 /NCGR_PEP_ID=MMETSP0176-20130528/103337_1 /TAXON_ID=216777 /ORGANISM="Proboscia alata, Strain PI-D3" /LENGTH=76 /DNA_ID=CAMNT_0039260003 /DNA_START=233 /DNA_END=460 /DNA_ORIENTATION=-